MGQGLGVLPMAGERAMEIYANVDAARFYERALAAGRRLRAVRRSELGTIYEHLGDVHWRLGEYQKADSVVPLRTPPVW